MQELNIFLCSRPNDHQSRQFNFSGLSIWTLSTYPICDQSLPARQRAVDLVSRMTTAEKITQLVHKVPAIPRVGLPEII